MKMIYNGAPVKSLNVHHFEMDTNDCDMIASDLQAGKTAVARGKKITGTGKSFEYAIYGALYTNRPIYLSSLFNVVHIGSVDYPIKAAIELKDMKDVDFSVPQLIGTVVVDGVEYQLNTSLNGNSLKISCDKSIKLQIFHGKDNYI